MHPTVSTLTPIVQVVDPFLWLGAHSERIYICCNVRRTTFVELATIASLHAIILLHCLCIHYVLARSLFYDRRTLIVVQSFLKFPHGVRSKMIVWKKNVYTVRRTTAAYSLSSNTNTNRSRCTSSLTRPEGRKSPPLIGLVLWCERLFHPYKDNRIVD